jgi:pantetheine-phosphate adenylyltransferase
VKFKVAATGGTFDHLHKGHQALIAKCFEVADAAVIGVTTDAFARKQGKRPDLSFRRRVRELEAYIAHAYPGRRFGVYPLDDFFGPGIASPEIEAIVVTRETAPRVSMANELRAKKGYPPLQVVVVDYVLADDGSPISSTRVRKGEITGGGALLRKGL